MSRIALCETSRDVATRAVASTLERFELWRGPRGARAGGGSKQKNKESTEGEGSNDQFTVKPELEWF